MRRFGNLNFFVIFSILFLVNDTSGLWCWRCSSANSKFCGAEVRRTRMSDEQKKLHYTECPVEIPDHIEKNGNFIAKCMIQLLIVNEVKTVTRSCYWEQANAPPNLCATKNRETSYMKMLACNTCVGDGCNEKLINSAYITNSSAVLALLPQTLFAILIMIRVFIFKYL